VSFLIRRSLPCRPSVRPSARLQEEKRRNSCTNYQEIWYRRFKVKSVRRFQISWTSNRERYMLVCLHFELNRRMTREIFIRAKDVSNKKRRRKLKTRFVLDWLFLYLVSVSKRQNEREQMCHSSLATSQIMQLETGPRTTRYGTWAEDNERQSCVCVWVYRQNKQQ
jgi:hypothetical protein